MMCGGDGEERGRATSHNKEQRRGIPGKDLVYSKLLDSDIDQSTKRHLPKKSSNKRNVRKKPISI
jgi:hypothetical protein